jgi:hypothetical protein
MKDTPPSVIQPIPNIRSYFGGQSSRTLLFIGEGSRIIAADSPRRPLDMPESIAPGYGGNGVKALDERTGGTLWRRGRSGRSSPTCSKAGRTSSSRLEI